MSSDKKDKDDDDEDEDDSYDEEDQVPLSKLIATKVDAETNKDEDAAAAAAAAAQTEAKEKDTTSSSPAKTGHNPNTKEDVTEPNALTSSCNEQHPSSDAPAPSDETPTTTAAESKNETSDTKEDMSDPSKTIAPDRTADNLSEPADGSNHPRETVAAGGDGEDSQANASGVATNNTISGPTDDAAHTQEAKPKTMESAKITSEEKDDTALVPRKDARDGKPKPSAESSVEAEPMEVDAPSRPPPPPDATTSATALDAPSAPANGTLDTEITNAVPTISDSVIPSSTATALQAPTPLAKAATPTESVPDVAPSVEDPVTTDAPPDPSVTKPTTCSSIVSLLSDNSLRRERPRTELPEVKPEDGSAELSKEATGGNPEELGTVHSSTDVRSKEDTTGSAMDVDDKAATTTRRSDEMDLDPPKPSDPMVANTNDDAPSSTPAATPKPLTLPSRELPVWIVESESEDEEGVDPFEAFKAATTKKTKKEKSPKAKEKRMKPLKVNISSLPVGTVKEDEKKEEEGDWYPKPLSEFQRDVFPLSAEEQIARAEAELEDSLQFFRESHEDQDPAFAEFIKIQKKKQLEAELKRLDAEDEAGRKEIEVIVAEQLKENQATTDRSVEKYKAKKMADEKKDMAKLQKLFSDKVASNQSKINQGVQVLKKRHAQETQRIMHQHRQQVQQRQIPEQMASKEWSNLQQRLRAKHERQIQEFASKGEEVKKRTEAEFQRERTKILKQYEKQLHDVENNRQGIYSKMYSGFQQLRQRYVKRHAHKILKKKEALKKSLEQSDEIKEEVKKEKTEQPNDAGKSKDDKVALRPPSPIKTGGDGFSGTSQYDKSGAASRHKHRKGMLNQIAKQLSVEIHNEGIWIAILQEKKDEKKKEPAKDPHTESENKKFMPWGSQARDFLESIICGEIPSALVAKDFEVGDSVAMNGGHVRCVLTDLRTSDETALIQRTEAIHEQAHAEVAALEKKALDLQTAFNNAEKMHAQYEKEEKEITPKAKDAIKDYESKKISWQNFRTKFGKFMGPDGNPLPQTNPNDRQKLLQATAKYKDAVETAENRAKIAQVKVAEAKQQTQKYLTLAKQTQRAAAMAAAALKKTKAAPSEGDRAPSRVQDMIAALELTAEKRRDQLNQKRNSSTSSTWVQNLPGVSAPLRRSLWHKMHRRRQQIVLRPSQETLATDLKAAVQESLSKMDNFNGMSEATQAAELQKAEQAFLLATHPVAPRDEEVPNVPSSSFWGEPGWHLVLDVPNETGNYLLPRAFGAPIVEKNLSEIYSAPGRQASSLIRTSQLRSLSAPLSAVSTVTSLAEINPAVAIAARSRPVETDPLHPTEAQLGIAYAFNPKILQSKLPPPIRRKSSSGKDQSSQSVSSKTTTKKAPQSAANQAATAKAAESNAVPKPARKRKSPTDVVAKPAQRRKLSSKPTAAQARAIQLQQQQQKKLQLQQQQMQKQQQLQLQQQQQQQQQQLQQQPSQPQQPTNVNRPSYPRQHSMGGMDTSQNSYNQYMNPMGTPPSQPPQQHPTYQQQLYQQQQQQVQQRQAPPPPQQQQFPQQQMAQLRMMQQQQHHHQQQPPPQYGQSPHGMQPMPQFFQPMQQQFAPQPMPMPGQVVGPPGGMPMNLQGNNNNARQSAPSGDDQNDPLFMLKEM